MPLVRNADSTYRHLFDGSDLKVDKDTIINLGVGAPGLDLLKNCCPIFQKATINRLEHEKERNNALLFQYGHISGNYNIRYELSKFFSNMYSDRMKSEDLIITAGATQGLHFLMSTLMDFKGYVFVDEFTHKLALNVIRQFQTMKIVPLKLNHDGVDLIDFQTKVHGMRFEPKKPKEFWAMYYTIPTNHNPTGINFSPTVCSGIIELVRKHNILVICDDVYNLLHYRGIRPFSSLLRYDIRSDGDFKGHVISNGSLSKVVSPGIRLGWLEVPPRLKYILDRSGILNSGGCFNNYTSGIVASLFQMRLIQPHMAAMCSAFRLRMVSTLNILHDHLPENCEMIPPQGGYYIWIRLPSDVDAKLFLDYCMLKEKIYFLTGDEFAFESGKGKNYIRISISFQRRDVLICATLRLCHALKVFMTPPAVEMEV